MNVLSLCSGIDVGFQALKSLNIKVDNYYASEIDPYAIQIAMKNHPEIQQLGDVRAFASWNLPKIDLILAGPPCQGFSISGKGLDWKDERSQLFLTAIEILQSYKPKYFLFENVASMKKPIRLEIDNLMCVKSVSINSNLVSAQNRERLYWANFPIFTPSGPGPNISDILEENPHDSFYLITKKGKLKKSQDKSACITVGGNSGGNHSDMDLIYQTPRGFNKGGLKGLDGKTPTISGSSWQHNNHLCKEGEKIRRFTPVEIERLFGLPDNYTLVLDDHGKQIVSNTQRYKSLGNCWPEPVIEHIFKQLPKD